jgi:hypothetical protein
VSIATDCRDAFHSKIEWLRRKAGLLQERHKEAPETAVHMEANVVYLGEPSKLDDIILTAVWEIDSGAHDLEYIMVSLSCHRKIVLVRP